MSDFEPFFAADASDGLAVPRPHARSPWSADMMHGRLLAGLAAREVEQYHLDEGLRPMRLTVDLFRSPSMDAVETTSSVLRAGRRIKVVEITQRIGEVEVARSVVVLMRTGEHPEGTVWTSDEWDVPGPDDVPVPPEAAGRMSGMDIRAIGGRGMGTDGRRQVWLRDTTTLVDGEPLTPFQRAAIASDFGSPLANSSSQGLRFINGDINLMLGRLPDGDWIGFDVGAHVGFDGVSVARCDLYDATGRFGFVAVSAVANAPMNPPAASPPPAT